MKYFITYYVHEESNLPKKGWLQSCIMCYTITSKTQFFSQIERHNAIIETQAHVCAVCKKKINSTSSSINIRAFKYRYNKKVNQKINEYVIQPPPSSTPSSATSSTPSSTPSSTTSSTPSSTTSSTPLNR